MKNIELNEKQLKSLKLFSYYAKSHGCDEATCSVYLYSDGDIDEYSMENWYCDNGSTRIEGYEAINDIVKYIMDSTDYGALMEDSDNSGTIEFSIDCNEKKLDVYLYENVKGTNELGAEYDVEEEDSEDLKNFFIEMRDSGLTEGSVPFDGGGDSGQIESYLETKDGNVDIPSGVEDWLYRSLESFYGGWEINEGSHGKFNFDFDKKNIYLEFNEHTDETESHGKICHIQF